MEYKHLVHIGYSEEMSRGLEVFTCQICGEKIFDQKPYVPNLFERIKDKIKGVDVMDFTIKKIGSK